MDARRKAAAASEEFGPSAWYRILKLMSASGLVAKLANTDMIWSERLNEGDPIPVNMGGYGRNFEMAIDAEMKTGEDVAGVSKRCDECNAAVVRVSKFLETRTTAALHSSQRLETPATSSPVFISASMAISKLRP